MDKKFTYKNAGVDIDTANKAKKEMSEKISRKDRRVLNRIGAFASLYDFSFPEYKEPVLVLKTEEPGSKQLLAFQHDRIESVCYDMINHLVNDCIVMGARPLSVQDAIICGKLEKEKVLRIVKAISDACDAQECTLTGGETSEQPAVINDGVYILTSSIVGIVEKDKIIDGSSIRDGDIVLGLESSGLHTNGYSLVRKVLSEKPSVEFEKVEGRNFIDLVLEPHRCYYQALKDLFDKGLISGMAHITGGGIRENLNRVLPGNLDAEIDLAKYKVLPVFKFIKKIAEMEEPDMMRTFNMGVGMALVASPGNYAAVMDHIKKKGVDCYEIGVITRGNKNVVFKGSIRFE